jgi:hypothetical protein
MILRSLRSGRGAPRMGAPARRCRSRAKDRVILRHEWTGEAHRVPGHARAPEGKRTTGTFHRALRGDTLVIETGNYAAGVLNQYVEMPVATRGLLHSRSAHLR